MHCLIRVDQNQKLRPLTPTSFIIVVMHFDTSICPLALCRDGSPSVTFKRVPKEGGVEGQLVDEWIKHHGPDGERDCNSNPKSNPTDQSFRHKQV